MNGSREGGAFTCNVFECHYEVCRKMCVFIIEAVMVWVYQPGECGWLIIGKWHRVW